MHSAEAAVFVATHEEDGLLLCTPQVPPSSSAQLRCRFASGDQVAHSTPAGVVCCPPRAGHGSQAYQVLVDGDEFAEGVLEEAPPGETCSQHPPEPQTELQRQSARFSALKPFIVISTAYLLFTTTDGAVRMIVLLHAYQLGFTAMETAAMFSLYELAGVATNLAAGFAGSRWGLRATLLTGLLTQLVGICALFGVQSAWARPGERWKGLVYITLAQMLCGVAKDLTKLGGKTVTKLVTPEEKQSSLFRLVSLITGWKNSMKGLGYFLGAACLLQSYQFALAVQLGLIGLALPPAFLWLTPELGRARKKDVSLRELLRPAPNVARLSLARAFLFGSRDLWFEVPLPFFLRDAAQGLGWERPATGAALACFIIVYGQVQSFTPGAVLSPLRQEPANKQVQVLWNALLTLCPAGLAAAFLGSDSAFRGPQRENRTATLLCGLAAFCLVFAVNSSIHSYLVVRYAGSDKVASEVGFYYMSNAVGRFVGTLASGAIYEYASPSKVLALGYCFLASTAFSAASTLLTLRIDDQQAGLRCGPCMTCIAAVEPEEPAAKELQERPDANTPPATVVATPAADPAPM